MSAKKVAIFTICSNNYLPNARAFFDSVRRHQSNADFFLCLADRALKCQGYYSCEWTVVEAEQLGIPEFAAFSFRYDVMEFNTALKPFMFQHLFDELDYDIVLYFDPDIEVFRPLDPIIEKLNDGASFFLTPHLCSPSEGDQDPNDITIMRAGVYNLGFLGVARSAESSNVLAWWARRLRYQCINAQSDGIFVDQKFMDLVPGFAPNAHISHDTTLNVAYWNVPQRCLTLRDGVWFVDGRPLTFFHYSGFDPNYPTRLSKHDARYDGSMPMPLQRLTAAYAHTLLKTGYGTLSGCSYAYGRFASGTIIHPLIRQMFRVWHKIWPDDPFVTYEAFLHEPWPGASRQKPGHVVTNFMKFLHDTFPHLRLRLDLSNAEHVADLVTWFINHAADDLNLDLPLTEPEASRLGALKFPPAKAPQDPEREIDITVVGYLRTASGVGEVGRKTLRSLAASKLRVEGYDIALGVASTIDEKSCEGPLSDHVRGRVQIFNVNADQLPIVVEATRPHSRLPALRINIPFWELSRYPEPWLPAFNLVDEIWAPSRFIQRSLAGRVDKPVIHMPIAIELEPYVPLTRKHFGLPDGQFVFFYAFDFLSFVERKNPKAAIQAFRRAFPRQGQAALVLKCMNGNLQPEKIDLLRQEVDNHPDIFLLEQTLSRADTHSLIATADAVLSLHRSEGFGLLLAEAILLGKPVIATGYSASRELVTEETGYPVGYQLVPVEDGEYPFASGQHWASPDISHAAWLMQRLCTEPARAVRRIANGQEHLRRYYSSKAVAESQANRLRILGVS